MDAKDFSAMAERVTRELCGKTISHASWDEWGMGYSLTLHFTDGTQSEITPEHDEGFCFNAPRLID